MRTVDEGVLLPAAELGVMNGIWEAYEKNGQSPVTTREVLACAPELANRNLVTILTFINRLTGRGYIKIEKQNPEVGRGNLYTPLVGSADYKKMAYQDFVERTMVRDRKELARLLVQSMTSEELAAAKVLKI